MEYYQIADLEHLTGIKAHTIRIWEKRYNLIDPHRTDTNIRYYDNEHARKLLNISSLINAGYKISKIAVLSDEELNKLILESAKAADEDGITGNLINTLTSSMLTYDEVSFEKTFSSSLTRLGMYNTFLKVIYPFLFRVGSLWRANETMPAQEHFASGIVRRKLMSAIDGLPSPSKKNKKFILFLPPNEWHEIGLLFAEYIIRSNGFAVVNLGQNVPYDNLLEVASTTKSSHAITFFISRRDADVIKLQIKQLLERNKEMQILVSASSTNKDNIPSHKRLTLMNNPEDLLKFLKN